jgi:hypothetical protein
LAKNQSKIIWIALSVGTSDEVGAFTSLLMFGPR